MGQNHVSVRHWRLNLMTVQRAIRNYINILVTFKAELQATYKYKAPFPTLLNEEKE